MALAKQKNCGAKEADIHTLPQAGSPELNDRSIGRLWRGGTHWSSPWSGIVVMKSRMFYIGHIDWSSFRLLPRTWSRTGKGRSRREKILFLSLSAGRCVCRTWDFGLAKIGLCPMVTSSIEKHP